tara:strand:- start:1433 stop:2326 length:894 start_codon:yes stop_codon:yes gene_type:complete
MDTKTLVGKDGYLFLARTSGSGMEYHTGEKKITLHGTALAARYGPVIHKTFMVVVPDKEVVCREFLPDGLECAHRPHCDLYKRYFGRSIIDGFGLLDATDYYKTDTHINNKGALKLYRAVVEFLNERFGLGIQNDGYDTSPAGVSALADHPVWHDLGDLTWPLNAGVLNLGDVSDTYHEIVSPPQALCPMGHIVESAVNKAYRVLTLALEDVTEKWVGKHITWECTGKHILLCEGSKRPVQKRVLVFYDSMLLQQLGLYRELFSTAYFARSVFNQELVCKIDPDLVIEARAERFLCA